MSTGQDARVKMCERVQTLLTESGQADDLTVVLYAHMVAHCEADNPGDYRTRVGSEGIHLYANGGSVVIGRVIGRESRDSWNWEVWTTDDDYPDLSCTYEDIEWLGTFDWFDDAFRCAVVEGIGAAT